MNIRKRAASVRLGPHTAFRRLVPIQTLEFIRRTVEQGGGHYVVWWQLEDKRPHFNRLGSGVPVITSLDCPIQSVQFCRTPTRFDCLNRLCLMTYLNMFHLDAVDIVLVHIVISICINSRMRARWR